MKQGQTLDGAPLLPSVSHTVDTQPGDTGVFLFQCDVQVSLAINQASGVSAVSCVPGLRLTGVFCCMGNLLSTTCHKGACFLVTACLLDI